MSRYFADHAWLSGDTVDSDVLIEVDGDRITAVRTDVARPADARHLRGVTLPGGLFGGAEVWKR